VIELTNAKEGKMEKSLQEAALDILKKHGKAMSMELVAELVVPALEKAAKDSATPIDDLVVAALKEPLKKALLDLLAKV